MIKPTIFLSHSSRDGDTLSALRTLLLEKTGASIEIFLSSDGQSIPLGRNWVHEVEKALSRARLMFVFMTPNSLGSSWLYFESGYAYSKGIRVVPVGFHGVDLGRLAPPLSLLQGFNIETAGGLNNLVAVINDELETTFQENIEKSDFDRIWDIGHALGAAHALGPCWPHVQAAILRAGEVPNERGGIPALLDRIAGIIAAADEDAKTENGQVDVRGMTIRVAPGGVASTRIECLIEPLVIESVWPLVQSVLRELRPDAMKGSVTELVFVDDVDCSSARHVVTGRLYDTQVKMASGNRLSLGNYDFVLGHVFTRQGIGPAKLEIVATTENISLPEIGELLSLLFDKHVILLER